MATGFNGSGIFVLGGPEYPAVASTLIQSAYRNTLDAAIATGLSNCITKDGQQTVTANIPLGGFKITGLGLGTAATDAASIANLIAATGEYVGNTGGTADVTTLTPSPAITAYAAGQTFKWIAVGANTTNVTINVSGLGAKALTKRGAVALVAGDILASHLLRATYDGTRFQLEDIAGVAAGDGTAALPTIGAASDPDTGLFSNGPNILGISTGGTLRWNVGSAGHLSSNGTARLYSGDGSAVSPSLSFVNGTSEGLYWISAGIMGIALNGITAGQITQGSFTGTLTGMTGATTGTVSYQRFGQIVYLYCAAAITGTSNTTAMTMTGIPAAIQNSGTTAQLICPGMWTNNGATINAAATINATTVTFYAGAPPSTTGFTNSGAKGLLAGFIGAYPLI